MVPRARPYVAQFLTDWIEYQTDCSGVFNVGSWTINSPPAHGTVSFAPLYKTGPCGAVWPFNGAYYTWTDTSSKATTANPQRHPNA